MKTSALPAYAVFLVLFAAGVARSHEVRPGYLHLSQIDEMTYDMLWKIPAKGDRRLGVEVKLPENCHSNQTTSRFIDGAYVEHRRITCEGGLGEGTIRIERLAATRTDVLVRIDHGNGDTQTVRLTPSTPEFTVAGGRGHAAVAETYLKLGVEHILFGYDHLLFILALLFLVNGRRLLLGTITAFTIAHSLTLASAVLGWVRIPQAPVESVIALSIMFVAVEILHRHRGREGIATRQPWLVAFVFGLLHGLGFAGALQEIGLPNHAIPLALAFFNVGVEVGQLLFAAAVFIIFRLLTQLMDTRGATAERSTVLGRKFAQPASYMIGTLAAFWFIQRTYALFV